MARSEEPPVPITPAGFEALKTELAQLRARRPAMVDRMASARSDGDLKENSAYHDARHDLGMLDGRVATIESLLHGAVVVHEVRDDGAIGVGSRVVVKDEFGQSKYTLVGPAEVDLARGLISLSSPLGAALMGRRVGETITFNTPGGDRSATVAGID
jgi:transcription elongation factor GreA